MRHFDAASVHDALPFGPLVEALEIAFREGVTAPVRHHHTTGGDRTLLLMPAWSSRYLGVKLVTVTPENSARGLPSVQGAYALFEADTGVLIAILDGTALTLRRTAAASALAARYLARPDATTLALFGAGALAPFLVRAHAATRPISRVLVWNRTPARAASLAAQLAALGFAASPVADRKAAVREADIVSCATMSGAPLVEGAWLRAGTHVDLVGAYLPTLRESDTLVLTMGRVFVDTRAGALAEAGDILIPIADGEFAADAIAGELADLCAGRVRGRQDAEEVTVFKSVGTALEDLAAANLVVARA